MIMFIYLFNYFYFQIVYEIYSFNHAKQKKNEKSTDFEEKRIYTYHSLNTYRMNVAMMLHSSVNQKNLECHLQLIDELSVAHQSSNMMFDRDSSNMAIQNETNKKRTKMKRNKKHLHINEKL